MWFWNGGGAVSEFSGFASLREDGDVTPVGRAREFDAAVRDVLDALRLHEAGGGGAMYGSEFAAWLADRFDVVDDSG
jgi:hypothetical protein